MRKVEPPVTHEQILDEIQAFKGEIRGEIRLINDRLHQNDVRMESIPELTEYVSEMRNELRHNTEETKRMSEVLDAWVTLKGAGNAVIWMGKVLAAMAVIGTAIAAGIKFKLWSFFGGGA